MLPSDWWISNLDHFFEKKMSKDCCSIALNHIQNCTDWNLFLSLSLHFLFESAHLSLIYKKNWACAILWFSKTLVNATSGKKNLRPFFRFSITKRVCYYNLFVNHLNNLNLNHSAMLYSHQCLFLKLIKFRASFLLMFFYLFCDKTYLWQDISEKCYSTAVFHREPEKKICSENDFPALWEETD